MEKWRKMRKNAILENAKIVWNAFVVYNDTGMPKVAGELLLIHMQESVN